MGLFLTATPALAAQTPWWHLTQRVIPTRIQPAGEGTVVLQASNLGNHPTSGLSTLTAELPEHLSLVEAGGVPQVHFFAYSKTSGQQDLASSLCSTEGRKVTCQTQPSQAFIEKAAEELLEGFGLTPPFEPSLMELAEGIVRGENPPISPVNPYEFLEIKLEVKAEPGANAFEPVRFSAAGGGAADAAIQQPVPIGGGAIGFGLEHFALTPETEGGGVANRAGSHPYQLTADVTFNRSSTETMNPPALPRNLSFRLPPGQLGNPTAQPECTDADFAHVVNGGQVNLCPDDTAIGAAVVTASTIASLEEHFSVPVFNLTPAPGEPARFGFVVLKNPVILTTAIRSGKAGTRDGDYGVTVTASNVTQVAGFISATTVFWGAPNAKSHDESRGSGCIAGGLYQEASGLTCTPSTVEHPPAFLTLPTDCAHPFNPTFEGVSWPTQAFPDGIQAPAIEAGLTDAAGNPLGLIACNQVGFDPRIESEPTSSAATSPTGLSFDIDFSDEGLINAEGVAQSQMKRAVVTLPQGFTTNPSVAEGLHACPQAAYEESTLDGSVGCPEDSKIGEVEIESPLVKPVVHGSIYVAKQGENPNQNNLLTIYMVARNPEVGVIVKQALRVTPDPVTGQLTTEVDNVPELPFSHFHLFFRQGQRAPLITPPACGTYAVKATMYPWSNPTAGVQREASFQITQGPEGLPCPSGGTPPFHPTLEAGTQNNAAGTYSPFYTHITRKDSEQEITHFSIKLPPGLSGKLVGLAQCSGAQIAAAKAREHEGGGEEELQHPSCPASSEVGHTTVGTGVGNVLAYAPGKLYLAGPYKGSNLSIVSITAAKVGPFDLGTVVIREGLKVDPTTAQVSVDAAGSDPIPHIVDGIPVHLRDIRIYVDRPNFTINPTSCAKMSTAATVLGSGLNFASEADDQPVTVTSPFQAADCASLGFKPELGLKLLGKTRRGGLPKLVATVTYPKNGAYANIASTIVTLPDSELLEQGHIGTSCTRVQFNAGGGNGEQCPAKSIYGHAKAITPLLEEPVEGPVYLRSNGGERQLPDLVAALHSKDIDVNLVGFIDSVHKKGTEKSAIRTRFLTVPDAPVSKFTLEMAGGKKGLLINSTNLCKGNHRAKSQFVGQNGKRYETEPKVQAQCGKQGTNGKGGKKKSGGKKKGGH